jgi:hypothetical protein
MSALSIQYLYRTYRNGKDMYNVYKTISKLSYKCSYHLGAVLPGQGALSHFFRWLGLNEQKVNGISDNVNGFVGIGSIPMQVCAEDEWDDMLTDNRPKETPKEP